MTDIEIKISKTTRMVDLTRACIGNDGENLQTNLIFTFKDEFVNGQGRVEYIVDGESHWQQLEKVDESYQIPVKNVMTKVGSVDMQLVITEGTGEGEIPLFKSNWFYMHVNKSINAVEEQPEGYDSWLEIANSKLNEIDNLDIDVEKVDGVATITVTKKDGTQESVEIYDGNGTSGGTSNYEKLENKPRINGVELKGNKTLDELGIQPKGEFITKAVDDLINYYLKSETYSKEEVNKMVSSIPKFNIKVVEKLPSEPSETTIYLLPVEVPEEENYYEEHIYVNGKWELIGTTKIDLTGYAKEEWVSLQIANFLTEEQINALITSTIANYYTKNEINDLLQNKQNVLTAGENITIENNVISATGGGEPSSYELPIASADTLGGVKVGENLNIDENGVLSASGGGSSTEMPIYLWKGEATTDLESDTLKVLNKCYQHWLNNEPYALFYKSQGTKSEFLQVIIDFNSKKIACNPTITNKDNNGGKPLEVYGESKSWSFTITDSVITQVKAVGTGSYFSAVIAPTLSGSTTYGACTLDTKNTSSYTPTSNYHPSTKLYTDKTHYENMTGYDATKTQVLENISGTIAWADTIFLTQEEYGSLETIDENAYYYIVEE